MTNETDRAEFEKWASKQASRFGREWSLERTKIDSYSHHATHYAYLGWQAARASVWRPIETAPKDGTEILACDDDGIRQVIRWGKNNHVPIYGWIRQIELYGEEVDGFDAKIWQPLPTPPHIGE